MFSVLNIAVLLVSLHCISCATPEADVIKALLANANPNVRPVTDPAKPVDIKIETYLFSIRNLDETKGVVDIALWVGLTWTDPTMVWKQFSDKIKKVTLPSCSLWLPDIFLTSDKGVNEVRLRESEEYDVSIAPNGQVYHIRSVVVTLPLKKNGDTWETHFSLGPWNLDKSLQTLHTPMTKVDVSQFTENVNYDLKSNSFAIQESVFPDTPDEVWVSGEVKLGFQKKK